MHQSLYSSDTWRYSLLHCPSPRWWVLRPACWRRSQIPSSSCMSCNGRGWRVAKISGCGVYVSCSVMINWCHVFAVDFRQVIFTLTTSAAIMTNAAIAVFTMDIFKDKPTEFKFWFFIIFQWVVFSFQVRHLRILHNSLWSSGISRDCCVNVGGADGSYSRRAARYWHSTGEAHNSVGQGYIQNSW